MLYPLFPMMAQLNEDLRSLQHEMAEIDKVELREDLKRAIGETADSTLISNVDIEDEVRCKMCIMAIVFKCGT